MRPHLAQTVTNFAMLVQLRADESTAFAAYIPALDQQQLVDLLSYCIDTNPYQLGSSPSRDAIAGLVLIVREACMGELMTRAMTEPF